MKKRVLPLLPLALLGTFLFPGSGGAAEQLPPEGSPVYGKLTTEKNTGDMNIIPFNNPDVFDVAGTGLQAALMIADYNGDSYLDLIVPTGGKPYNGHYVFYGGPNSRQDCVVSKCYKLGDNPHDDQGRGTGWKTYTELSDAAGYPSYRFQWDAEKKHYICDEKSIIPFFNGNVYPNWPLNNDGAYSVMDNVTWPKVITRGTQITLVDFNGDGHLDLVRSAGNWNDYGWTDKFTSDGVWGDDNHDDVIDEKDDNGKHVDTDYTDDDPLHGWIMIAINNGEHDVNGLPTAASFSGTAQVLCTEDGKEIDMYGDPYPSFYDWDNDGDLDLVCGNFIDDLYYFENIGTSTEPVYAKPVSFKLEDGRNFQMELCMEAPMVFDWNNDGLLDIVTVEEDGRVSFIENTGKWADNGAPIVKEQVYFKSPADILKTGILNTPYSLDWDGDGDEDLFTGDSAGFFSFFENITFSPDGTTYDGKKVADLTQEEKIAYLTDPVWAPQVRLTTPEGEVIRIQAGYNGSRQGPAEEKWGYTVMSMGDWDGDGDQDILANSIWGKIVWMENLNKPGEHKIAGMFSAPKTVHVNSETPDNPSWNWWDPKPYELVTRWRTSVLATDLDKDGLTDIVMVDSDSRVSFYKKRPDGMVEPAQHLFRDKNGGPLYLSGYRDKFCLADWDGDGDLDIIRCYENSFAWQENIGTKDSPWVYADPVKLHPRTVNSHTCCPTPCDWNLDGVPDLVIGAEDGHYYYFVNKTPQREKPEALSPETGLVALWDFEGETEEECLKDKAHGLNGSASAAADDLTNGGHDVDNVWTKGQVQFRNGTAFFPKGAKAALTAKGDSVDLNQTGEMTIVFTVRTAQTAACWPPQVLINKRKFPDKRPYAVYIDNVEGANVSLRSTAFDSSKSASISNRMQPNKWAAAALSIARGADGKLIGSAYVSTAKRPTAQDFGAPSVFPLDTDANVSDNIELFIGNCTDMIAVPADLEFGEVRIYNRALTPDDLAGIGITLPSVDAAALQAQIAAGPAEQGIYTDASWEKLAAARKNAESALNADGSARDAAYDALKQALSALKKTYYSIEELGALLNTVPENGELYTAESWSAVKSAAATAKELVEDNVAPLPNSNSIRPAYKALQNALKGLEKR